MTVAFVVPGPLDQVTGGYLFDRKLVEGLRALGREVHVVELAGRFPDADETARAAAAAALAASPAGSVAVIDGLALPAFATCLAREAERLRVVGFIHHPLSHETGLTANAAHSYAEIEARLWPLLKGVICPSAHTARAVTAAGVSAERVVVAEPGTEKSVVRQCEPRRGPLHLLTVGTVTPRKGHLLLIEALTKLRDLDWRLTCIGSLERDRDTARAVQASIASRGLGERIALAGECAPERLDAAYREADVFVLPSYEEGYGMACAEALAHHLPIVATTAGALPEVVPPTAGLLVPPGDVAALKSALRKMMVDAPFRFDLASGAARVADALPDWPTAIRRWAAALDRLAA